MKFEEIRKDYGFAGELGSGFKIAMRDLRFGRTPRKSQSGFIDSVGSELHSQLLEEAIKRNGNGNKEPKEIELILQIDAYLLIFHLTNDIRLNYNVKLTIVVNYEYKKS